MRVHRTLTRSVLCTSVAGVVLAVATPAWAPEAPNDGIRQGWESTERDADRRLQLELQRRQFEHERRILWEQTAQARGPSNNGRLNNAVAECGNQVNLRAYAWDSPGGPRIEWYGGSGPVARAFKECVASREF